MKYIFLLLEMIIELYEFHFQFQLFTFLSNLESSKVNQDLLWVFLDYCDIEIETDF